MTTPTVPSRPITCVNLTLTLWGIIPSLSSRIKKIGYLLTGPGRKAFFPRSNSGKRGPKPISTSSFSLEVRTFEYWRKEKAAGPCLLTLLPSIFTRRRRKQGNKRAQVAAAAASPVIILFSPATAFACTLHLWSASAGTISGI